MNLSLPPQAIAEPRKGLFANRTTLYVSLVFIAALLSYAGWARSRSIFACQTQGYSASRYLAYCGGGNYADYEHGALLFDLEPPSLDYIRGADVLVLGNSKIVIALSNEAVRDWFADAKAKYYLMGFSYGENAVFAAKLMDEIRPRASVLVVNVDDFFARKETQATKSILHNPDARSRYEGKRFWQFWHSHICGAIPSLCGRKYAVFRARENGAYYRIPYPEPVLPENAATYDTDVHDAVVKTATDVGFDFLKRYGQGRCVILTNVPYPKTNSGDAEAIARNLGLPLVTPDLDGMNTSDGYHLDRVSADRWARAFLAAAGPEIRSCIEKHRAAAS